MCWQKCMELYYEMLNFDLGNTSWKDIETKLYEIYKWNYWNSYISVDYLQDKVRPHTDKGISAWVSFSF